MTSEYGSRDHTHRPHYHAIIFGVSSKFSALIEKAWSKGFVKVKPVNYKTCAYVAKYIMKGSSRHAEKQAFESGRGKKPNFFTMSRRPGIGINAVLKRISEFKARLYVSPPGS